MIRDPQTVVILSGGKSLNFADVEYCRDKATVIAVNTAYQAAPWAYAMYARDLEWWLATPSEVFKPNCSGWVGVPNTLPHSVLAIRDFGGQRWTGCEKAADKFGLRYVQTRTGGGLSVQSGVIHTGEAAGASSGYQAVNLAITEFHAKRILLLGFDMLGGHWNGDHPAPCANLTNAQYAPFAQTFNSMVKPLADLGVEVVNCALRSLITCFRFSTVQAELPK